MSILPTKFSIEIKIKMRLFGDFGSQEEFMKDVILERWTYLEVSKWHTTNQTKVVGCNLIKQELHRRPVLLSKGVHVESAGRKRLLRPCCSYKSDLVYILCQKLWAAAVTVLQHPCCLSCLPWCSFTAGLPWLLLFCSAMLSHFSRVRLCATP